MFVSLMRVWVVCVVSEVASFREVWLILGVSHKTTKRLYAYSLRRNWNYNNCSI